MALRTALPEYVERFQYKLPLKRRRANLSDIAALVATLRSEAASVIILCGDSLIAEEVEDLKDAKNAVLRVLSLNTTEPAIVVDLHRQEPAVSTTEDRGESRQLVSRVAQAVESWQADYLGRLARVAAWTIALFNAFVLARYVYGALHPPATSSGEPLTVGQKVFTGAVLSIVAGFALALPPWVLFKEAGRNRVFVSPRHTSAQRDLREKVAIALASAVAGGFLGLLLKK